jgi:hypothetical protein
MNARFLNILVAQIVFIAPAGAAVGIIGYAGVASLGIASDVIRSIFIAAGVLASVMVLLASWKTKHYQVDPTIPTRAGLNAAGHFFVLIGSIASIIAIPVVLLSNREPYYVVGGMAILIGGAIAIVSWTIGSTFIHRSTVTPTPETHVRCPDCKRLVVKSSRACEYCGCKLVPQS